MPITSFYQGYKKFDLRRDELLARDSRPAAVAPSELLRLFKVSRRRDLDIATFTAAIRMQLDGDTIADARIAFGAVGPVVIRARRTEDFLRGKPFDESTMRAAGDVADRRNHADQRRPRQRRLSLPTDPQRAAEVLSRADTRNRIIDFVRLAFVISHFLPCPTSAKQFRTIRPSAM